MGQRGPDTYGYRYANYDTLNHIWRPDSIYMSIPPIRPSSSAWGATVEYLTGDSTQKVLTVTDDQARDTLIRYYDGYHQPWHTLIEKRFRYDSTGNVLLMDEMQRILGGSIYYSLRLLLSYDTSGRQTSQRGYNFDGAVWIPRDSSIYRYSTATDIPDTVITFILESGATPIRRELHYKDGSNPRRDTLLSWETYDSLSRSWIPLYRQITRYIDTTTTFSWTEGVISSRYVPNFGTIILEKDTLFRRVSLSFDTVRQQWDTVSMSAVFYDLAHNPTFKVDYVYDSTLNKWIYAYFDKNSYEYRQGVVSRKYFYYRNSNIMTDKIDYIFQDPTALPHRKPLHPLRAYPNPATDQVRISLPAELWGSLGTLTDATGHLCAEAQWSSSEAVFDLQGLPPGLYQARFIGPAGMQQVPILKQ